MCGLREGGRGHYLAALSGVAMVMGVVGPGNDQLSPRETIWEVGVGSRGTEREPVTKFSSCGPTASPLPNGKCFA